MDRDDEGATESDRAETQGDSASRKSALLRGIEIVEALLDKEQRARVLKEFLIYEAKWLLGGLFVSAPVDVGEAWQKHSVSAAWGEYGTWWLLVPLIIAAIPIAFASFLFLVELVLWALMYLIYILPSKLFKDSHTWGRILKWTFWVAFLGYVAFFSFAFGIHISGSNGEPGRPPAAVASPPSDIRSSPALHFDWQAWMSSHALLCALLASGCGFFLKTLSTEYIKIRFKTWSEPKPSPTAAPKETHVLYGPDNQVIRTFEVEKQR